MNGGPGSGARYQCFRFPPLPFPFKNKEIKINISRTNFRRDFNRLFNGISIGFSSALCGVVNPVVMLLESLL